MAVVEIGGRRINLDENQRTVTAGGRRILLDQTQPSFLNRVREKLQAVQRPSRQLGKATERIVTARAPSPVTSLLFGPAGRTFPMIRAVGEVERQAIGRTAGEVVRTATNPVDLAILGITPQLFPARATRLAVGAGLGTAAALGEERTTPKQVGFRAGTLGILSALPFARRFRPALQATQTPRTPSSLLTISPGPASQGTTLSRTQKIITALEEAAPVRGEQEALFTEERGRRLARLLGIRKKVGGEAGFKAELGTLKGELPKVQFESIRQRFNQTDIDGLFDDVNSSALDPWEQLTAKAGLAKLFQPTGGQVPTQGELHLLGQVFGPAFVKAVRGKLPLFQKLTQAGIEVANLPRALMASFDLSAPLRQGLFLIGRPQQWLPAFGSMFRQFGSERFFRASQEAIRSRPTFPLMQQARLALTDIGESVSQREEAFMSRLGERIPFLVGRGVRASNRGYVGFLNKLRADTFDDFVKKGKQLGIAEDPGFLRSVARYVNAATGRGELGKLQTSAVLLNTVFFSPRLLASRLNLLNPVFYARLHPQVRQRAIADALTMTSAGLSVLGLAKLNGVEVGTDLRSADFGKLKVGNTRFDIWGGFQQPIVALSRLLTGETVPSTGPKRVIPLTGEFGKPSRADIIFRFLQSKQAPVLSFITTMLRGQTIGRGKAELSNELVDRFIPLFLSDLFEVIQEHGVARGWMAVPGAFGVGTLTYGDLIPILQETPSGRTKVGFRDQPTAGEALINLLTGRRVSNLPESFKEPLAASKRIQQQRDIKLEEARDLVRKTGRSVQVGNSLVFRNQRGIIETRTQGKVVTPERTLEQLLGQMEP